ncbi:MAG: TIGR03960 family B12-binding radical SAM protein [Desulfovibrio sp.]|nr:TIGR03960 family B12-binding radical SAM protein [Desulfovibrio sp.]
MREFLSLFPAPSHYAGIEDGACRKNIADVTLHIALAFPDLYEVGMSYLGQKILYGIVNSRPHWWAERVMAPAKEVGDILKEHGAPLCTLESDTPLGSLHCLAFSITHELCYTNVLYMLDLAGIPFRSKDRNEDLRQCPLVIAGGGALLGAEPLTPFIDLMVLGDGEESLPELLELQEKALAGNWTRSRLLDEARRIHGIYVPSLFETQRQGTPRPLKDDYLRPTRRIVADINKAAYPTRQVVPIGAVHNRLSIEIARGCTRGCRFCHAGMVYRPARERSVETVSGLMTTCLKETGFDEISFLALSTGDYSALKALSHATLDKCLNEQIGLSLPSQRVGSIDDEIIERIAGLRRTGMTLAPEAGSQRLRDVINKGITEDDILLHVQKLLEHGWRMVKLYFMIGLPTETDEDLKAIADLCRKVRDAAGKGGPRLQVSAALSPFVPKPFTPFQWVEQISEREISRRVALVREHFQHQKCLKLHWHEPAMSRLEGILSRADRHMADVVEKAYRKGAVFTSWMEHFSIAPWLEALDECGIDADACTASRDIDAPLPWDHLEAGVSKEFLKREWRRALEGKTTPDCRYASCRQCGACDTKAAPSRLRATAATVQEKLEAEYKNRLILPQRDQNAHVPQRDGEGRLICRPVSSKPPKINSALTVKAVQYRIWHEKHGGSAYLSQLELQAVLERALRRAELPVAFSQGFHPMPLISFGRALPVGVESDAEWFSLSLHTVISPGQLVKQLGRFLPPGMGVRRVDAVTKANRAILSDFETYLLTLPEMYMAGATVCFARLAASDSFDFVRDTKKGPKKIDIRPLLSSWATSGEGISFTADWRTQYLSPILLCRGILSADAAAMPPHHQLHLRKTSQTLADGLCCP